MTGTRIRRRLSFSVRAAVLAAAAAVAVGLPWLVDTYTISLAGHALAFAVLALSVHVHTGLAGLPTLGQAAPFGVGAYTAAILARDDTATGVTQLAVAVLTATLFATVTGSAVARTRGITTIMATLTVAELAHTTAVHWTTLTGGSDGLAVPAVRPWPGAARLDLDGHVYLWLLTITAATLTLVTAVGRSPYGLALDRDRRQRGPYARHRPRHHRPPPYRPRDGRRYRRTRRSDVGPRPPLPLPSRPHHLDLRPRTDRRRHRRSRLARGCRRRSDCRGRDPRWRRRAPHRRLGRPRHPPPRDRFPGLRVPAPQRHRHAPSPPASCRNPVHSLRRSLDMLELHGLTRRYGDLTAVDNITLTINDGQRHALIGANGAGKTTLLHLIAGTIPPATGRIVFDGQDITRRPEHRRVRAGIVRTFQHPSPLRRHTTVDNLAAAIHRRDGTTWQTRPVPARRRALTDEVRTLLDTVGLTGHATTIAGTLSYAQQRHLDLAVALACRPRLLLLDEPAAGLTTDDIDRLAAILRALPRTITIVIIEHHLDLIFDLADVVTVLHHGQTVMTGSPDQIRTDPTTADL